MLWEEKMQKHFKLDGITYAVADLNESAAELHAALNFTEAKIVDLRNLIAILNRAKQAYINDISMEAVQGKTGIKLAELFSND